jgi:hypothetical protein
MACFGATEALNMDTEETHLCHSGDHFHGKSSAVEMGGDERHAFFIHKFSDSVSEVFLFFTQRPFYLKIVHRLPPLIYSYKALIKTFYLIRITNGRRKERTLLRGSILMGYQNRMP